ncbi:putative methyltransferase-domain-containing protein, partial [Syncephalastrum racemosum]
PGFHGAGKGGLEYAIESNGPLTFYLLLSSQHRFARGASIVPLMVGPIHLVNKPQPGWNTNLPLESWPDIPSTAHDTYRLLENVVVHETWDAGIPGKIWDSALVMLDFIKKQQPYWQNLHVIDLSAGTGLLGIYLGKLGIQATITELDDAVNLIYENKALNGDPSAVNVKPLLWGDESQAAACGKADIIVASDVLYETEFFEDLAQALVHLCKPTTVIYIGYKRRGLDNSDEERFWSLCRARGFDISV